ncbi:MAG TPA: AmmeMemoRadiSam system protein A [Burkholderiales bacterium]|nr:AmmeMemoRadiSam system protein A [Burkholderiales bacterium]
MMYINAEQTVLPIARATIGQALGRQTTADESAPWLQELRACFVTLKIRGELRGCIGSLQAQRSLLADLKANALAAAFRDPRFDPLTDAEFNHTRIEVSLISTIQLINFTDEQDALNQLRPAIDGIIFEHQNRRSTFLPQMWESLPSPRAFMELLKKKAGLSPSFWAEDVKLSRYTVIRLCDSENTENLLL